jgi:hypothetical protein
VTAIVRFRRIRAVSPAESVCSGGTCAVAVIATKVNGRVRHP